MGCSNKNDSVEKAWQQGCQMVCFKTKNTNLGKLLEGLRMKNVCIFYDHLEYSTAIWYNLGPFGILCGRLVYFPHFGMFGPRKIWQPCLAVH
jgi:hypothetical protein